MILLKIHVEKMTIVLTVLFLFFLIYFDKSKSYSQANFCFLFFVLSSTLVFFTEERTSFIKKSSGNIYFFILLVITLVGLILNIDSMSDFFSWVKFCIFIFSSQIVSVLFFKHIKMTIILITMLSFIFSIFAFIENGYSYSIKMSGGLDNSNSLGLILSVGIGTSVIGIKIIESKVFKFIFLLSLLMIISVTLYSNSRTAVISPLISILISIFFTMNKRLYLKKIVNYIVFTISIVFLLNTSFIRDAIETTIVNKFDSKDDVTSGRLNYIIQSIEQLRFFTGSNTSDSIIVDNTNIAIAYDFGILSSLFFFSSLIYLMFILFFKSKKMPENIRLSCLFFSINALFYLNLESIRYSLVMFLFLISFFYTLRGGWQYENHKRYS